MNYGELTQLPSLPENLGRQFKNKGQLIASLLVLIAELHREPAGEFDASIGQETDADDLLHPVLLELLVEVSVGKAASTAKAAATINATVL